MNIKKIIVFCTVFLFSINSSAQENIKNIKIGIETAFPPFSFIKEDGSATGFDIEIANALCEQMKVSCEFVSLDWDGLIPSLKSRKIDAIIASMVKTEERKQVVDFTNKYYTNKIQFIGRKNDNIQINKKSLKNKTVGTQRSTTSANYLEDNFQDSININLYDTQENVFLDLNANRIDLVLADYFIQKAWLQTELGGNFEFKGEPIIENESASIAIRKDDKKILNAFNKAINEIVENGTYEKISKKYFQANIY